jgi:trk system potassium uptake protein TrkH
MGKLTPPQLLVVSFLCAIFLGAVLLSLPVATRVPGGISFIDSLFTATSATCVTGLIVRDTGTVFSPFGRGVIFFLFQVGGLGIMTFSTLFAVMLGRKLGFQQSDVISTTLDRRNILGFKKLLLYIVSIALGMELMGALALFLRWKAITNWTTFEVMERSVFHAVSAFCNAGFSLFSDSMEAFQADPYIIFTVMALIFAGGIGFVALMDILGVFVKRDNTRKLGLQTRVVLLVSVILVLGGAVFLYFFENGQLMKDFSLKEKLLGSLFQSVTARTAGFNTLPIGLLSVPSLLVLIFLMFIGASPGSTGGGIKTCTFAVLLAMGFSFLKNNKRVRLFDRSIPRQVIRESFVIVILSAVWIFIFTVLISVFSGDMGKNGFLGYLFEVVSAFGTVGLSTGVTPQLNPASKICIILTMFAGRIGPLTLALAIAFRERQDKFIYPEETIMVG